MDLWEDKEIRFDVPVLQMKMRPGEKVIDRLDFVEDTKGNGGDKGRLIVTNLRILWHSLTVARISLSIGFNCVLSVTTKIVNSKLRGTTEALYILTKYKHSRFEFIFTNLVAGNTRHFTSVMGVHNEPDVRKIIEQFSSEELWKEDGDLANVRVNHDTTRPERAYMANLRDDLSTRIANGESNLTIKYRAYISSRIYRDMKLRGAVVRNKQLRILPLESIYTTVEGIWNLSSDQGNLGSFIISNIRLVWYAEMNENFNVSLPYICISSVRIRESKFGPALVVESCSSSGGYVLGFRIDPLSKLQSVVQELISLYNIHAQQPEFGVQYSINAQVHMNEEAPVVPEEMQELDESVSELSTSLASYCTETADSKNTSPIYCQQLGLAIEPLKPGYTLDALWQVMPPLNANISV